MRHLVNNRYPRSKQYPDRHQGAIIHEFASVGANATIMNVEIGKYALIGAGAVVVDDVAPFQLVLGNPAKCVGWVDQQGRKLTELGNDTFLSVDGKKFSLVDGELIENQ